MSRLLHNRVATFVGSTALVGSFADWTLFAALVAIVDARTQGSAWATAAVLLARVLPAVLFAPIAARRVDKAPLRRVLRINEFGRVVAVGGIAVVATINLPLAIALLVALEFCAAMQAAARESLISRHIPADLHTSVNTVTAVASYGLLPVGALVVQFAGSANAIFVAMAGYLVVLLSYMRLWPTTADAAVVVSSTTSLNVARQQRSGQGSLMRTVAAAGLGLAPIIAIFTVAPRLAEFWLGDASATAVPMGILLIAGALGFFLANRGMHDWQGLAFGGLGLGIAAMGAWPVGLALLGVGTGVAYLALQTRLQAEAQDPSDFAKAFAVLKLSTIAGTLAGPSIYSLGGVPALLAVGAVTSLVAVALAVDVRPMARRAMAVIVGRMMVIEVVGERYDGPAVVVSNHPNAVDGVVALAADLSMRPIARWQRQRIARAGIWLADAVVTTAGTDRDHRPAWEQASSHLQNGGRIWLAPEGGAHASRTLAQPRSGAVRMAHAAGVPIQALGIKHVGAYGGPNLRKWRPWKRPRVHLVWGDVLSTTGAIDLDNDRMMRAVAVAADATWQAESRTVAA